MSRLFNPRSVAAVTDLATDIGRIGKVGGVRAMKMSVEAADSTRDIKTIARTAERVGDLDPPAELLARLAGVIGIEGAEHGYPEAREAPGVVLVDRE